MMKSHGIPEWFWIVTVPTPCSTIGDICFRCDLRQFAKQIRGGLDEKTIVAVYADETAARTEAQRLLKLLADATK
jgi:hypothetical protein